MMYKELKQAILKWLLENENQWNRVSACNEAFRAYIFDASGNYLIGGQVVSKFITDADKLLYGKEACEEMKVVICMPTGQGGIQDGTVIRDALLTVINRITFEDERSGEFEADNNKNMVTFKVTE